MTYNGVVITEDMVQWNITRLHRHQALVADACNTLLKWKPIQEKPEIVSVISAEAKTHDHSKEIEPEYTPYILVSWRYKMREKDPKFDYSTLVQGLLTQATSHHVKNNPHHPEYWVSDNTNMPLINPTNRNKPLSKALDCTKMSTPYIFCMAADWVAMSIEKSNSPFEWYDKNVNVRWLFTSEQTALLHTILEYLWK